MSLDSLTTPKELDMRNLANAHWMQKDFDGRGARTAHLVLPGRQAVCGTHMGYGNLAGAHEFARRCGSCVRISTKEA